MLRRARTKSNSLLWQDPFVWGLSGAYVSGMIIAGVMGLMLDPAALQSGVNYNTSSAAELDGTDSEKNNSMVAGDKQNLLVNGSFELPIVRAQSEVLASGAPQLGWRVQWARAQGGDLDGAGVELLAGYQGWEASEGAQFARLDAASLGEGSTFARGLVAVSQTVNAPTGSYTLTFDFAAQPKTGTAENELTLKWNGEVLAVLPEDGSQADKPQWHQYVSEVKSNGGPNTLEFVAGGAENGKGVLLDNVVLTPAGQ